MASEIRHDNICSICKSEYRLPRILECFHVFCSPCLERLINKDKRGMSVSYHDESQFSCPLCGAVFATIPESVESLTLYKFHRKNDQEHNEGDGADCQMCETTEFFSFCKDCNQTMCRSCHEYHMKHKIFRNHLIEKNGTNSKEESTGETGLCNRHKRSYTLYCKACNIPICPRCQELTHCNHKTLPFNSAVDAMKASLTVTIGGLKSKLPYINNFVENVKSEEKKYWTYIEQTQCEMKTAAVNLKDVLCKSVDMVLAQNLSVLDNESSHDKRLIKTYIEKNELESESILKILKTADDTLRLADQSEIATITGTLCRQINLQIHKCFQSKLTIKKPKFRAGEMSSVQNFVGFIDRENIPTLNLELELPSLEMTQFPTFYKLEKISVIRGDFSNSDILGFTNNTVMCLTSNHGFEWVLICYKTDGSKCFEVYHQRTPQQQAHHRMQFCIIGIHSRSPLICCDIKIIRVEAKVELQNKSILDFINLDIKQNCHVSCILRNGNFLIFDQNKTTFHEVCEKGREKRTFKSLATKTISPHSMLVTMENIIIISSQTKVLAIDFAGSVLNTHTRETADFRGMCQDRHGNVFIADYNLNRVCLFTSNGHFSRDVITSAEDIANPKALSVDGCGNLWVLMNNVIVVFSYL